MISNYLKELIENNNRIIIPDFGAFMIQDSPEGKQISFNDFLKFNDGLLVNQIIKSEKISKNQASDMIKDFIKEVEKSFAKNSPFEVAGLGFLTKDSHGNIKFEAKITPAAKPKVASTDEKPTIILDEVKVEAKEKVEAPIVKEEIKEIKPAETKATETKPVEAKPVETKATETKPAEAKPAETKATETKPVEAKPVETKVTETKPVETKSTETKPIETIVTQKPPVVYSQTEQPPKATIPPVSPSNNVSKTVSQKPPIPVKKEKNNSIKIVLISLLVLFVIFGSIGAFMYFDVPKHISSYFSKKTKTPIEAVVSDSTVMNTTLADSAAVKEPSVVEEPKIIEETTNTADGHSKKYYIVAGSFKKAGNAERYNKKLTAEGYSSEIVMRSNGFHLVSYKLVYTRSEAQAEWNKMREQNPQVWIYSK